MSKLNQSTRSVRQKDFSQNGNLQFVKSSAQILFETVVSTLYGKDSYYESSNDKVERMKLALTTVVKDSGVRGAMFAVKTAQFAREEMHIRTIPIVMIVELLKVCRDNGIVLTNAKEYVSSLITRADQLTDMYAYALTVFGEKNKIPLSIKKGVAQAFNKFDAYQLAKYNRDGGLTFKSLLRIVHSTPKDENQSIIFSKIMSDSLESPNTWEVLLSTNGQKSESERKSDKDLWTDLVMTKGSGSLGYMALLRNLRNICKAQVDSIVLSHVCERISSEQEVLKSKQLPWAFINAYDVAITDDLPQKVVTAIATATEHSLKNVPSIGNKPWIILDCSGSMNSSIQNDRSGKNTSIKIGAIFAAALFKASKNSDNCALTLFSDRAETIKLNPLDSVMTLYKNIMSKVYGGGTNLEAAFKLKSKLGFEPDSVVVLSDMEVNPMNSGSWGGLSLNGVPKFDKDTVKIAVNLNSGNTTPLDKRDGWQQLSGWSESIFKYIEFDKKSSSIVDKLMKECV